MSLWESWIFEFETFYPSFLQMMVNSSQAVSIVTVPGEDATTNSPSKFSMCSAPCGNCLDGHYLPVIIHDR